MKLTEKEILGKQTEKGGWTRKTLAEWGVPWPPPKGWKRRLIRGEAVPRPMTGFISTLTPKQKIDALAYQGPEDIGGGVIQPEDGRFFAVVAGLTVAGPFETNAEAWRALDRFVNDPISPSEKKADWLFQQSLG